VRAQTLASQFARKALVEIPFGAGKSSSSKAPIEKVYRLFDV
jgi:hypothetical protein